MPAVACGALALACALAIGSNAAARQPDGFWQGSFRSWAAEDKKDTPPKGAIVFVGSSSIRLWPIARSFPVLPARNRGLGGAQIDDVNHFVEPLVLKYEPKVVVFYAGENDIGAGAAPERILDEYRSFVGLVHAKLPSTRIVFISIKPSPVLQARWSRAKEANRRVEQFCATDKRLRYVDVATSMLGPNAKPRGELFTDDGLHMNASGYRLWTRILTPVVESAFAEP